MVVDVREPTADRVADPEPVPAPRRWWLLVAALAAAWLVPLLAHLVGADLFSGLLVWVGTAAVLRSGKSVVDRLVIAGGLLLGLLTAAGMLFSVWPWGLHPVPVAGLALTALVLVAVVRKPSLPLRRTGRVAGVTHRASRPVRFDASDLLLVAVTLGVTALMFWPLRGGSDLRMALLGRGEDGARHFALFDHVLRYDGYLYFHTDVVGVGLQRGFETYPQGTHLLMALTENAVRSGAGLADPLTRFDHFVFMYAALFGIATGCLLWAARHVLGPGHRSWAFAPYAAIVAGYFFLGDGIPIFLHGFVSEIAAVGPYALLIALLVRPLRDMREQIVVVAALVTAVSMIYYLFLLSAAPIVLVWLIVRHRQLMAYWRWSLPALLIGGAFALSAPVLNLAQANSAEQLTRDGGIEPVNTGLLTVLVLAIAGGLFGTRVGRRSPAWRMLAVWLAGTLLYLAVLYVYSLELTGAPRYYFSKGLHQLIIVALVGVGAIGLLVPRTAVHRVGSRRRQRLHRLVATGAVTVVAATALVQVTSPYPMTFGRPGPGISWGEGYARRQIAQFQAGTTVIAAYEKIPAGDTETVNIVYVEGVLGDFTNYTGTLWLSVLIGNNGTAYQTPLWVLRPKTEDDFVTYLKNNPDPVRIFTNSSVATSAVDRVRREDPGRRVDLIRVEHPR